MNMDWRIAKSSQDWQLHAGIKTADKLNDFLKNPQSRPDLQTPEGQEWLEHLTSLHNDKTDQLMPWLTREWKKGRVLPAGRSSITHYYNSNLEQLPLGGIGIGIPPANEELPVTVSNRANLSHWGDFLNSNHPIRREMGDIMQHKIPEFQDRIWAWDKAMEEERSQEAARGGTVVHQWPDNWTVRRLDTPDELASEGDAMGHCVGSYADEVARGNTSIYSLRDPQGQPHVTTEIMPNRWVTPNGDLVPDDGSWTMGDVENAGARSTPHGGEVVQIQGAANQDPKEEYKQRMREWFNTVRRETPHGEPLKWSEEAWDRPSSSIQDISEAEPHDYDMSGEDEYGLTPAPSRVDWESVLMPEKEYKEDKYGDPDDIYELAKARREIPELGEALRGATDRENDNFDKMNADYIHTWAGEWPEGRDDEEWHEMSPEEQHQEQEDYETRKREAEDELARDHPGMQMVNRLHHHLNKHYNGKTGLYENEIQK